MASPQKSKGDRAELALVKHLQANGFPHARRGKAGGEADLGDIFGIVDRDADAWTVQVADRKWRNHAELEAKCREAAEQSERAGTPLWCLVAKRPGATDVGRWFVWLPTWAVYDSRWYPSPVPPDSPWHDLACLTVNCWLAVVAPADLDRVAEVLGAER